MPDGVAQSERTLTAEDVAWTPWARMFVWVDGVDGVDGADGRIDGNSGHGGSDGSDAS